MRKDNFLLPSWMFRKHTQHFVITHCIFHDQKRVSCSNISSICTLHHFPSLHHPTALPLKYMYIVHLMHSVYYTHTHTRHTHTHTHTRRYTTYMYVSFTLLAHKPTHSPCYNIQNVSPLLPFRRSLSDNNTII